MEEKGQGDDGASALLRLCCAVPCGDFFECWCAFVWCFAPGVAFDQSPPRAVTCIFTSTPEIEKRLQIS